MNDDTESELAPNPYANNSMKMVADDPVERNPVPSGRSGCGCIIRILLGLMLLALIVIGVIYYVVMHTSWPLRSVAELIEKAGADVDLQLKGVSGSISSGMQVESMVWKTGQVSDVRIKYNGIADILYSRRLILTEIHVGKAHLNVTGFQPDSTDHEETIPANTIVHHEDSPLKLLQIDRLSLNDIEIRNDATGFQLSIPTILWTGFKAESGKIEFGELTANSDRLTIETTPSKLPDFQRHIQVAIFPKLHSRIRKTIPVSMDIAFLGDKFRYTCSAFDGKLTSMTLPDQSAISQCQGLNLEDYFDAALPRELILNTVHTSNPDNTSSSLEIRGGSFKLGRRTFLIIPQKIHRTAKENRATVVLATSPDDALVMNYVMTVNDHGNRLPTISQQVTSNPPMNPRDTLAQLFFAKLAADLSEMEQQELDKISESFDSPTEADETSATPELQ